MRKFLLALTMAAAMLGAPGLSEAAGLVANINVSAQTMTVFWQGRAIRSWPVSTARRGYYTPRGAWRPTRMQRMWYSRKYDNAPMPFSVFFHGGYAIHGTNHVRSLGRPASHGCIRLRTNNAAEFYAMVREMGPRNTRIVIED